MICRAEHGLTVERVGAPGERGGVLLVSLAQPTDENATEAEAKYRSEQCGSEHGAW